MVSEKNFTKQEEVPEKFPSQEDVKSVFETFLQGRSYKELRILSNGGGVYLYEIQIILENGEKVEYNYQRANYNYRDISLPTTARFSASIHMISYDVGGMPNGAECVANYRDGVWEYVSSQGASATH